MTIFKDRLPSTIRIKRRWVASEERVREARNKVIAVVVAILGLVLLAVLFTWLES